MSPSNTVNSSTFIGEYTEGGMPSSHFDNGMLIIGGDLGSGVTMTFTFAGVGTKYVRLTITDALGRTSNVEHNVIVSR